MEVKKKHHFDDATWARLGEDDALVESEPRQLSATPSISWRTPDNDESLKAEASDENAVDAATLNVAATAFRIFLS
jgi:hypothetical protein